MGCGTARLNGRGPKNSLNLKILVSKFVPRDLERLRHGTLRAAQGPRGAAQRFRRGSIFLLFPSIFLLLPYINNLDNSKLKIWKITEICWCREEERKLKKTIKKCYPSKLLCRPLRSQARRPSRSQARRPSRSRDAAPRGPWGQIRDQNSQV